MQRIEFSTKKVYEVYAKVGTGASIKIVSFDKIESAEMFCHYHQKSNAFIVENHERVRTIINC